jgi:ferrous iron transport protein A
MPYSKTMKVMEAGSEGVVKEVANIGILKRLLLEIGFVPGTTIYCVSKNNFTDSMTFRVRGATITFRTFEAGCVKIL